MGCCCQQIKQISKLLQNYHGNKINLMMFFHKICALMTLINKSAIIVLIEICSIDSNFSNVFYFCVNLQHLMLQPCTLFAYAGASWPSLPKNNKHLPKPKHSTFQMDQHIRGRQDGMNITGAWLGVITPVMQTILNVLNKLSASVDTYEIQHFIYIWM